MQTSVNGSWSGWSGGTIVELSDGSVWEQAEYVYEYHYAYRPAAKVVDGRMEVEGMTRSVRVTRIHPRRSTVRGSWEGWSGSTEVTLDDGSRWKQEEYHYEYHYSYRPSVLLFSNRMLVSGMTKPIRVRPIR